MKPEIHKESELSSTANTAKLVHPSPKAQGDASPQMPEDQRNQQIKKEAKASLILFFICMAWSIGWAIGLSGRSTVRLGGLPLWWILSVPGVFVIAVVGVIILITKVFVNMDLDPSPGEETGAENSEEVRHD